MIKDNEELCELMGGVPTVKYPVQGRQEFNNQWPVSDTI
jgi:hypothetical protein